MKKPSRVDKCISPHPTLVPWVEAISPPVDLYQAMLRAVSAMTRRYWAEECWSQIHHVRRLVSPIKPCSNPGKAATSQPKLAGITQRQAHNAHCINVQRSSAAALWGESSDRCVISVHDAHNISFILLKLALVGRLPFVAWHIRPRRVYQYREGGGSSSESILGESGKWRGHRAACMGDVRMSLCGDTR